MENIHKDTGHRGWCCSCGHGGSFFGWVLLIIGVLWLARDFGLIAGGFSFWAVAFVVFGLYLVAKSFKK